MTAKELATLIDGRQAGRELTAEEERQAAESGLVVLYTPSADFLMSSGAIKGQLHGVINYSQIHIAPDGILASWRCNDNACPFFRAATKRAIKVDIHPLKGGPYCTFTVDIPHEKFRTYLDDFYGIRPKELYCVGLVFSVADLPGGRKGDNHVPL